MGLELGLGLGLRFQLAEFVFVVGETVDCGVAGDTLARARSRRGGKGRGERTGCGGFAGEDPHLRFELGDAARGIVVGGGMGEANAAVRTGVREGGRERDGGRGGGGHGGEGRESGG